MNLVIPNGQNWLQRVRFMAGELERTALEGFGKSVTVDLPSEEYERFTLSDPRGAFTEWKSVESLVGRAVMFKAHGPTAMGSHRHSSPEVLIVKSGELVVRIAGVPHTLTAGDTITTQAGEEHSAHYLTEGECLCIWPALDADRMTVDVLA